MEVVSFDILIVDSNKDVGVRAEFLINFPLVKSDLAHFLHFEVENRWLASLKNESYLLSRHELCGFLHLNLANIFDLFF